MSCNLMTFSINKKYMFVYILYVTINISFTFTHTNRGKQMATLHTLHKNTP